MITTIITDFSRVLLFPKDTSYNGSLNELHQGLLKKEGEDYDFFKHFLFNEELFALFKNLNGQYPLYIFTTDTIQQKKEVRDLLDAVVSDIFIANNHEFNKDDEEAYVFIANKLQKMPQTFLYIDDHEKNVEAAKKAGMNAILYQNNKQLSEELEKLMVV